MFVVRPLGPRGCERRQESSPTFGFGNQGVCIRVGRDAWPMASEPAKMGRAEKLGLVEAGEFRAVGGRPRRWGREGGFEGVGDQEQLREEAVRGPAGGDAPGGRFAEARGSARGTCGGGPLGAVNHKIRIPKSPIEPSWPPFAAPTPAARS